MSETPSPNGLNGRDITTGRFSPGWKGGPGNPFAAKAAQLRAALLETVTADDIKAVIIKLVDQAKGGDVAAAKVLLDRTIGKVLQEVKVSQGDEETTRDVRIQQILALAGLGAPPPVPPAE